MEIGQGIFNVVIATFFIAIAAMMFFIMVKLTSATGSPDSSLFIYSGATATVIGVLLWLLFVTYLWYGEAFVQYEVIINTLGLFGMIGLPIMIGVGIGKIRNNDVFAGDVKQVAYISLLVCGLIVLMMGVKLFIVVRNANIEDLKRMLNTVEPKTVGAPPRRRALGEYEIEDPLGLIEPPGAAPGPVPGVSPVAAPGAVPGAVSGASPVAPPTVRNDPFKNFVLRLPSNEQTPISINLLHVNVYSEDLDEIITRINYDIANEITSNIYLYPESVYILEGTYDPRMNYPELFAHTCEQNGILARAFGIPVDVKSSDSRFVACIKKLICKVLTGACVNIFYPDKWYMRYNPSRKVNPEPIIEMIWKEVRGRRVQTQSSLACLRGVNVLNCMKGDIIARTIDNNPIANVPKPINIGISRYIPGYVQDSFTKAQTDNNTSLFVFVCDLDEFVFFHADHYFVMPLVPRDVGDQVMDDAKNSSANAWKYQLTKDANVNPSRNGGAASLKPRAAMIPLRSGGIGFKSLDAVAKSFIDNALSYIQQLLDTGAYSSIAFSYNDINKTIDASDSDVDMEVKRYVTGWLESFSNMSVLRYPFSNQLARNVAGEFNTVFSA